MNAGDILDAIGLLDDSLIQEAEEYSRPRKHAGYRPWISLAACLAVVIALGYGAVRLTYLGGGNGAGAAPGQTGCASNESQGGLAPPPGSGIDNTPSEDQAPDSAEPALPEEVDQSVNGGGHRPAIMVDGILYWSTGVPAAETVDEGDVRTVTSYINTVPEMDGQTNFSQDLSARYAMTSQGLAVWMDEEWILFEPAAPEEG